MKPPTSRAIRGLLTLCAFAATLTLSPAHADTPIVQSLTVDTYPITPYNSGYVQVHGVATPGMRVYVTASDIDGSNVSLPEATSSSTDADPGQGTPAGYFEAIINITNQGTHDGTRSTVLIQAVAQACTAKHYQKDKCRAPDTTDPTTPISAPATQSVFKDSADVNDVWAPEVQIRTSPPSQWCHFLSTSQEGGCRDLSRTGSHTLIPGCAKGVDVPNPFGPPFHFPIPPAVPCNAPLPSGYQPVQGIAVDSRSETFGIASEIQDIIIQVTNDAGDVVKEFHNLYRLSTTGFFNQSLAINDYPPGNYTVTVTAIDALGHSASDSRSFEVFGDTCPAQAYDQCMSFFRAIDPGH